jgi:hypothetical protein
MELAVDKRLEMRDPVNTVGYFELEVEDQILPINE